MAPPGASRSTLPVGLEIVPSTAIPFPTAVVRLTLLPDADVTARAPVPVTFASPPTALADNDTGPVCVIQMPPLELLAVKEVAAAVCREFVLVPMEVPAIVMLLPVSPTPVPKVSAPRVALEPAATATLPGVVTELFKMTLP